MEIKQLRYFVSVAKNLSFTKAAEDCCVVQSAITHQIAALENEIGARLFRRDSKSTELTEAGDFFLKEAKSILEKADAAVLAARAVGNGYSNILRIGYCGLANRKSFPLLLAEHRRRYPETEVILTQAYLDDLLIQLERGSLDCFFSMNYDFFDRLGWLGRRILFPDKVVLVVSKSHPFAGRKTINISEIENEPFVLFSEKGFEEKKRELLPPEYPANLVSECTTAESMQLYVEAGYAISIGLEHSVDKNSPALSYIDLDMENPTQDIVVCWNATNHSPALVGFMELFDMFDFENNRWRSAGRA